MLEIQWAGYGPPTALIPHARMGTQVGPLIVHAGNTTHGLPEIHFSSVLASSNPWCATWAGQLLSARAWCQVAVLCGYDKKHVARSMHSEIQRAYGDSIHDSTKTAA
uniref:Uncharacterized protein n=1 Tax=Eutreptiella gymnastica TaxID=73025 RepID=A0A7S4G253_9EUGL